MQSILISLLSSFCFGVSCLVYDATRNLIIEMYSAESANYFSQYIKETKGTYRFLNGSPKVDDFIRKFEKIS